MKQQIGMMQGRLTQPKGRGIQFFPFENWEEEFRIARKLGLNEIEFIFDFEDYKQNPLWTIDGVNRIKEIRTETGIQINAVCFDYFMRRAFFKEDVQQVKRIEENTQIIKTILESMKQLQIKLLEIPLVDDSSLKSDKEKAAFREWLLKIIDYADETINIALETDLSPKDFKEYLNLFNHPRVGANYDSGNSSGIGYDLYEEVTTLGDYIFNIHIKDRIYQGTTVSLGTGSADFDRLFKGLSEIKYKHNFILQAARGVEGEEQDNIVAQMEFVSQYIKKYNI